MKKIVGLFRKLIYCKLAFPRVIILTFLSLIFVLLWYEIGIEKYCSEIIQCKKELYNVTTNKALLTTTKIPEKADDFEVDQIIIGRNASANNLSPLKQRTPRILVWTNFFGQHPLRILNPMGNHLLLKMERQLYENCSVQCKFTSSRNLLLLSDVVVFHSTDINRF